MKVSLKNFKFKPQLGELTKRDFILVIVLVLAIEGYFLITYMLSPAFNKYDKLMGELREKENVLNGLMYDYSQKDKMEDEILELGEQMNEIGKQLPPYLSQEEVLQYLEGSSINSSLRLKSIVFENAGSIPLTALTEEKYEKIGPPAVNSSIPMLIEQKIGITFEGDYSQLYSLLKEVEANIRKIKVNSLTMTINEMGTLNGVANASFVSYWDDSDGQKPFIMESPQIEGKNSPFAQYSGYAAFLSNIAQSDTGKAFVTPDFYIKVNSNLNNSAKIFISNSYNTGSEARYDANNVARSKLTISGGDGTYTYKYNLGSYTIVESKPTQVKEGKIRLEVLVQARRSNEDRVGLILDIENGTNMLVEVNVIGDSSDNPRFILGSTTGNVTVR